MRGGSRREDMAHWILSLKESGLDDLPHKTAFITEFSKCRNCVEAHARPQIWALDTTAFSRLLRRAATQTLKSILALHARSQGINPFFNPAFAGFSRM